MKINDFQELKFDKYREKTIKFYDKGTHYDLIFCGDFDQVNKEYPVYSDLLYDLKQAQKQKQIHVWIHSCGGSVSTLVALTQQLEEFEYVVTIGLGQIDSAGFNLWCLGDERYLSPSTLCMYHAMSSGLCGKSDEIKDYGDVLKKYQSFFEQNMNGILTEEQIGRGRYTQIWILGKDLIERGVAYNYTNYKKRQMPISLVSYKVGDECYIKTNQGLYDKIQTVQSGLTRKEMMSSHLYDQKEYQSYLKAREQIGEQFIHFFKMFLDTKLRVLSNDGFFSNNYLMQSWNYFSETKMTLEELKDSIQKWVQYFGKNICFERELVSGKKKGFGVKITTL